MKFWLLEFNSINVKVVRKLWILDRIVSLLKVYDFPFWFWIEGGGELRCIGGRQMVHH